jgi:hypothetical protein
VRAVCRWARVGNAAVGPLRYRLCRRLAHAIIA